MRRSSEETDGFEVDEDNGGKRAAASGKAKPKSASMKSSTTSLTRNPSSTFKAPSEEKPKSPYSAFTHQIRKIVPEDLACRAGCSGEKCKYCNSEWPVEDMAIRGVFSHWITLDILAMARPTTKAIEQHRLIEQMKELGIKSIFNLQMINEHKACGRPLEKSGFSYDPIEFTKNDIYYYNFGFQDYSIVNMVQMIDMVKVLSFALQDGKAAVHCHAGLGRTGLFIACYLIFRFRMPAKDTVYYIRDIRKRSVQMNDQIEAIQKFDDFIRPLRVIYSIVPEHRTFTLTAFVHRQRYFLHGYESRALKYIPKVLHVCVNRLRQLLKRGGKENKRPSYDDVEGTINQMSSLYVERAINAAQKKLSSKQEKSSVVNVSTVAIALASHSFDDFILDSMRKHEYELNTEDHAYDHLMDETDPFVLVALMWHWLDHLQIPPLREQEIIVLSKTAQETKIGELHFKWDELDKCTLQTINCVLDIYRDVFSSPQAVAQELEDDMVFHLISVLTHASIPRAKDLSTVLNSQTSLSSTVQSEEQLFDHSSSNPSGQRLIFHTNRLKRQHIRTLYYAIMTLIRNDSRNGHSTIDEGAI